MTIELIVKRARVSFKTFYKHFASKDECFLALFNGAFELTEKAIRRRLGAKPLSWPDQVALALRVFAEQVAAEPAIARAVIVESPTAGPVLRERYEEATRAFGPLFRAGREHGPRGHKLPETIEDTLAGAVFWSAYERLIVDDAGGLVDHLPTLVELVISTYLGQDEAARLARSEGRAREPALA